MFRRDFLKTAAAIGAASLAKSAAAATESPTASKATGRTYSRIATEEAFITQEIIDATKKWLASMANPPKSGFGTIAGPLAEQLLDMSDARIKLMDEAGVDIQLVALSSPGVQMFDAPLATALARSTNDRMAEVITKRPDRYVGLAAVAPQDPAEAAKETERAVNRLHYKGILINSHTQGEYLDDRKFWPIFEACEALGVPLYIHPQDPGFGMGEHGALTIPGFRVGWSWGVETGTHALRLIAGGVFDRFPKLQIAIGHMGEMIPFFLKRIDNRYLSEATRGMSPKMKRLPSEYFKDHFVITTSGINYPEPFECALKVMGPDRVLFAVDYPFEVQDEAVKLAEAFELAPDVREKFFETNARRVFKI